MRADIVLEAVSVWLLRPRTPAGQPDLDHLNPDPSLRQRHLCGLTIIWGLQPDGPSHWTGGWLYDPKDGVTYDVTAERSTAELRKSRGTTPALLRATWRSHPPSTQPPRGCGQARRIELSRGKRCLTPAKISNRQHHRARRRLFAQESVHVGSSEGGVDIAERAVFAHLRFCRTTRRCIRRPVQLLG
jgi:hypothetical protein